MRVWVHHTRTWEEFGAKCWAVEWHTMRPDANRDDFDPHFDTVRHLKRFTTRAEALKHARKMLAVDCFGCVCVQAEEVDWFVEEDRVAEWADVGEPEYVEN